MKEARQEEFRQKKQKGRKYLEWFIIGNWQTRPDLNRDDGNGRTAPTIGGSGARKDDFCRLYR